MVRPLAAAPSARAARRPHRTRWLAAAVVVGALIAIGLVQGGAERTPTAEGAWQPMATSPLSPRFAPVSLWLGDRLLVWGGHDADGTELADGATYDPAQDRWTAIADQPFPYERRSGVGVGQDGGSVTYATPGAWFEGRAYFVVAADDAWGWDLVTYDPASDAWSKVDGARFDQQPDDALVMREGTATVQSPVSLVVHDGELVVFGWHSQRGEYGWATFDPATVTWGAFTGVPGSGLEYGMNGATGGPILVGGRHLVWVASQGPSTNPRGGYSIDLDTGEVIDVDPPVDASSYSVSGFAADGTVVGAWLDSSRRKATRFAARLDPATGRWSTLPALQSGPAESADDEGAPMLVSGARRTFVIGGLERSYVVSGLRSTPGEDVLAGDRWLRLPDTPIDLDRTGSVAVWTGDQVIIWGGATTPEGDEPRATVPLADGARFVSS